MCCKISRPQPHGQDYSEAFFPLAILSYTQGLEFLDEFEFELDKIGWKIIYQRRLLQYKLQLRSVER